MILSTETINNIRRNTREIMQSMGVKAVPGAESDRQRGYRAACAATRRAVDDDALAALAGDPPQGTINPDYVDGYSKISSDDDEMAAGAAAARLALGKK